MCLGCVYVCIFFPPVCACVFRRCVFVRASCTQALITVRLSVFFPVEQQSEAFNAKALVNNSGLILFAVVCRNKTGR